MNAFSQTQFFGDTNPLFWSVKGWCEGPNKPRTDLTGRFCAKMLGVIQKHMEAFAHSDEDYERLRNLYNYYSDRMYGFDKD